MKKLLGVGLLVLGLSGCATMELMKEPTDYNSAYSRVMLTTDEYRGTRTYKSTALTLKDVKWKDADFLMGQLSLTKTEKAEQYCLLTLYNGSDWAFFKKAYDINQKELPLINSKDRVGVFGNSVHVNEQSCIGFTRSYLESSAAADGLNIKLAGQNKDIVIKMEPYFIKAFLDAVDYSEKTRFNK